MTGEKKEKILRKLVALLLVVILVFALLQYLILTSGRTKEQYEERLEQTAQQIASGVNRHITSSTSFLKGMAEVFASYEDIHSEEALELLTRVSEQSDFKRMWLTKTDGSAKSSEGNDSDATGRGYFESALRGESGVSELQISKVNGEKNVVIYTPIYNQGNLNGMVIGIYALDELADIINIDCFGGKGYSHLVSEDGEIISFSKHENAIGDNKERIQYWEQYGYSCPVGINDWHIFITLPEEVVQESFRYDFIISLMVWVELAFVLAVVLYDRYRIKNKELQKLAQKDSMTKLYNRGTIEEYINMELKKVEEESFALVLFDVDHFKEVNDTLGHMAGDELLCKISEIMNTEFRRNDMLGRLGGDEFAVFMRGTNITVVRKKVASFVESIRDIASGLGWDIEISISIGIALAPRDGKDFESLYKIADENMYEAKKEMGNSVVGIE